MRKASIAAVVAVLGFLGLMGTAGAQSTDPQTATLDFFEEGIGQVVLIVIAVAGAGLALVVLFIGLRMAAQALRSRGQRVV